MVKTFAAACLVLGLALAPLAAVAETGMSGSMPDKSMSAMTPKKPMTKHRSMHKKTMATSTPHSDMSKSGDMQQKM